MRSSPQYLKAKRKIFNSGHLSPVRIVQSRAALLLSIEWGSFFINY